MNMHNTMSPSITFPAIILGIVASFGGFMLGWESGQISGFLIMADFMHRFLVVDPQQGGSGDSGKERPAVVVLRIGLMVGLLPAGALCGALMAGKLADRYGRRRTIHGSAFVAMVGTIVQVSSSQTTWIQFATGRFISGMSIGLLSVVVPMYQSESSPVHIRGILVSCYQLFITLGIFLSNLTNFFTSGLGSEASWIITELVGLVGPLVLASGMLWLPESPRYAFRKGRADEARNTIARLAGVPSNTDSVADQIEEMARKLQEDDQACAAVSWTDIFTGPRMLYRTLLGIVLQAGQQLTGANFFFYFGSYVFRAVGVEDAYVTSIILSSVNVGATFGGIWVVQNVGRRVSLVWGALVMSVCFVVYSIIGRVALDPDPNPDPNPNSEHNKVPGGVLIAVSCLFIGAFASTWGPVVWTAVAELYPAKYRAPCMAVATASNWSMNFLLSFFTSTIVNAIGYLYGLVFAGSCASLAVIVYFFLIESKDRRLEEIDSMYLARVAPRSSAKWPETAAAELRTMDDAGGDEAPQLENHVRTDERLSWSGEPEGEGEVEGSVHQSAEHAP